MKYIKKILFAFFSLFKIKNVIVFESFADFSENSRALFEYLIQKGYNEKYKIYWFVEDDKKFSNIKIKNVKFIKVWTETRKHTILQWIKIFIITKNAKVIFFSNRVVHRINKKTKWICLNHGTTFKNVKGLKVIPKDIDYIVSASDKCSQIYCDQLELKPSQMLQTGNPRNDILFKANKSEIFKKIFKNKKYSKVILWFPTFRKQKNTGRVDSNFQYPYGIPLVYAEKTLLRINNLLKKNNSILLLKLHPAQDVTTLKGINLTNLYLISDDELFKNDVTITELYVVSDALITDYSGLYFDYLLTNKIIGFAIDDFEQYKEQKGFAFENPLDYMAGFKMYNSKDLEEFLLQCINNIDIFKKQRIKLAQEFNVYADGNSSKRIVEFLDL